MSNERKLLEETLRRTAVEMDQSRSQTRMLQQRLCSEAAEHQRNQDALEQIAERALRTRVFHIEARAETDRLELANRIE
eukprot:6917876-Prorocentrum_lima.AAC.1